MAAVDFTMGTPFASALQGIVQPKLAEYGWTTGDPEDSTIFEYILLMLGNNKDESQIASELSNDLLDLGPENNETQQFAHWLFEQIHAMQSGGSADAQQSSDANISLAANDPSSAPQDMDMEGEEGAQGTIPTGPKAMRNGSGAKQARGGRMLNNLNRQMGRNDDSALHRVRGSQGAGRINSHNRDPPKGPRGQNVSRGLEAMANGRGMGNMNMQPGMNGNGMGMGQMGGMPGMPAMPMGQNGMPMLDANAQMALMQMYEQQAQMMQQIFSGQQPKPFVNPNFQNSRRNGRPLNERMSRGGKNNLPPSAKFSKKEGQDENMAEPNADNGDGSAMEVEGGKQDPFNIMCHFNLKCKKSDCPYAHQSPAAPQGTPVDMNDVCSFDAKCTNKKCVGKHHSPAQRSQFQAEQECMFYPNCRDMNSCPYKHPSKPPCRNGADCTTAECPFWHSTVMCKYTPCTNKFCPYKHAEGQKTTFKNKEWVRPKDGEEDKKDHVSERRFINENAEEELIIPGKPDDNQDVDITT